MRFVDLLRVTVLLSGGVATVLALACVIGASAAGDEAAITVAAGWWIVASAIGGRLGRHEAVARPIGRALADSTAATMMPEVRPAATVVNRLWPVLVVLVVGLALAVFEPQVAGLAAGFGMLWALLWRRQERAVQAIEERDGVTFFVERTSPVRAIRLTRVPGLRREVPELPTA